MKTRRRRDAGPAADQPTGGTTAPDRPSQDWLLSVAADVRSAFPHPAERPELVVIDVDPRHLHAFWEVPPAAAAAARRRLAGDADRATLVLRLVAVDADGAAVGQPFDIEVVGLHGQFYIDIWDQPRRYRAELGVRQDDGGLLALAPAVTADLPALGPADDRSWREIALPPPAVAEAASVATPPPAGRPLPGGGRDAAPAPSPRPLKAPPAGPVAAPPGDGAAGAAGAVATDDGEPAARRPAAATATPATAVPPGIAAAPAGDRDTPALPLPAPPPWAEPAAIEHAAAAAAASTVILAGHGGADRAPAGDIPAAAGSAASSAAGSAPAIAPPPPAPPGPPPVSVAGASTSPPPAPEAAARQAAPSPAAPAPAAPAPAAPAAPRWQPLIEPFPLPPDLPGDSLPDGLTTHWPFPETAAPPPAPPPAPPYADAPPADAPPADAAEAIPPAPGDGPPPLPLEPVVTVSSFVHGEPAVEFEINAELHIFGRARPGSVVSVYGRPVSLRPDGTFSITRPLPNGALVMSLLVSRDGGGPDDRQ